MSHRTRHIATEELAERIREALNDFYTDDFISDEQYQTKSGFMQVLRAINYADRLTVRDMNMTAQVVMFVPADTNNILFNEQYQYVADYIEDIDAQQEDLIDRDYVFFLGKNQYLNVLSIRDRFLYVYDKYPTGADRSVHRIKKLSPEDYKGVEDAIRELEETYWATPYFEDVREEDSWAYFLPDEQRVVLSKQFESPHFLQFRARLMPGVMSLRDVPDEDIRNEDWDTYKVLTPHWGFELLIHEALDHLLPISAAEARAIIQRDKMIHKKGFEDSKAGDSNVIVPHHSF